jgi:3-hydroxyacyl-CoA dehydrogenase
MGRGIVQLAATAGMTVELADVRREAVTEAIEHVGAMVGKLAAKGKIEDPQAVRARLVPVDAPDAPAEGVDLVVEAVREDLTTKRELFAALERVCPQETIFATNTSSLSVTEIAAELADPGRLVGLHFFNPVPLMRLVEVVPGTRTHDWLPGEALELVRNWGHEPVLAKDAPGFLVNHAGRGLNTEALQILTEALAAPADVDRVARDVLGLKLGPFELLDLTGLDVSHAVLESIWSGFHGDPRLRPSWLTRPRVAGVGAPRPRAPPPACSAARTARASTPTTTGSNGSPRRPRRRRSRRARCSPPTSTSPACCRAPGCRSCRTPTRTRSCSSRSTASPPWTPRPGPGCPWTASPASTRWAATNGA